MVQSLYCQRYDHDLPPQKPPSTVDFMYYYQWGDVLDSHVDVYLVADRLSVPALKTYTSDRFGDLMKQLCRMDFNANGLRAQEAQLPTDKMMVKALHRLLNLELVEGARIL